MESPSISPLKRKHHLNGVGLGGPLICHAGSAAKTSTDSQPMGSELFSSLGEATVTEDGQVGSMGKQPVPASSGHLAGDAKPHQVFHPQRRAPPVVGQVAEDWA